MRLLKRILVSFIILVFAGTSFCQKPYRDDQLGSITVGILEGGGSIIGVDYEQLALKNVGLQIGGGLFGMDFGVNIHFRETIKSSFLSLQYVNQFAKIYGDF